MQQLLNKIAGMLGVPKDLFEQSPADREVL